MFIDLEPLDQFTWVIFLAKTMLSKGLNTNNILKMTKK
jgi:hypothetical protein